VIESNGNGRCRVSSKNTVNLPAAASSVAWTRWENQESGSHLQGLLPKPTSGTYIRLVLKKDETASSLKRITLRREESQ